MAIEFPYRFITGLPPKAQQEIWQDLQAISNGISTPIGYDAFIDPTLAADDLDTLTFRTPFAAIAYLADTVGRVRMTLGWIRGNTDAAINSATETGNYGGATGGLFIQIEVIGPDGVVGTSVYPSGNNFPPLWAINSRTDSGKFQYLEIRGIEIETTATSWMTSSTAKVYAEGCNFDGQGGTAAIQPGIYRNCLFNTMRWPSVNFPSFFFQCSFNTTGGTMTRTIYSWNCHFNFARGSAAVTCTAPRFYAAESAWSSNGDTWGTTSDGTSGATAILNFTGTTEHIYISSIGELGQQFQGLTVNVSFAITGSCVLEGVFWAITLAAPSTSGSGSVVHQVRAAVEANFDITGPANIAISGMGTSGVAAHFLRGANIAGTATVWGSRTSGTALSFVGVTESAVVVSLKGGGTNTAGQGYTINAASANNVFLIEGEGTFPTASVNSSTTTAVINHLGAAPSGTASGDLSGTYPGPLIDLLTRAAVGTSAIRTRVTGDAANRWQLVTDGTQSWGDGTAAVDTNLYRSAANILATDDDFALKTAGKGLQVKEGANAKMGTATLVAGTVTVATTAVTANSRILITVQSLGTVVTPKTVAVTARTAATSFVLTSEDGTDTSVVAWMLVEPS